MYVITGATGNTGKVAAETLLDRGKKVRVVVRDASKAAALAAKGAEVAIADLQDDKALARAFEGAEGVYLLLPPSMTAKSFRAYQDATTASLASAVRASRVPHVVLLSSIGAHLQSGTGPIQGLYITEHQLGEIASARSTFIRAGYFMENLGGSLGALEQGILPSFVPGDLPIDMIATRDIGELAASLLAEGPQRKVVNLGGPPVSMRDVAATLSRILGKPIEVAEAPLDAVVPAFTGFGMTEDLAALYREMLAAFGTGRVAWEPQHRQVPGKTPLEAVLRGLLGKA